MRALAEIGRRRRAARPVGGSAGRVAGVLDGLAVDTDLRWTLLTGLTRAGRADDAAVEAELERDNTISGKEFAAAARAAMPTAEAKAARLAERVASETPNETMRSIAIAFQQPDQATCLASYVDRYLDAAGQLWDERGVFHASTVLTWMFPREAGHHGDPRSRGGVAGGDDANPAARRYVSEGLDEIERALRAQARDAS